MIAVCLAVPSGTLLCEQLTRLKREPVREMKGTLVLLVLALLALAAIAIAAEPMNPAVRQLATSTATDEPVAMVLSGAALLAFASALKRAG